MTAQTESVRLRLRDCDASSSRLTPCTQAMLARRGGSSSLSLSLPLSSSRVPRAAGSSSERKRLRDDVVEERPCAAFCSAWSLAAASWASRSFVFLALPRRRTVVGYWQSMPRFLHCEHLGPAPSQRSLRALQKAHASRMRPLGAKSCSLPSNGLPDGMLYAWNAGAVCGRYDAGTNVGIGGDMGLRLLLATGEVARLCEMPASGSDMWRISTDGMAPLSSRKAGSGVKGRPLLVDRTPDAVSERERSCCGMGCGASRLVVAARSRAPKVASKPVLKCTGPDTVVTALSAKSTGTPSCMTSTAETSRIGTMAGRTLKAEASVARGAEVAGSKKSDAASAAS
ncbi:hypothetical protein FA09DRAFT_346442 [Tilletiopsis washingtonensis]|uniref:Uncharacterized protein n=1 Tax=Tilletiopsis washingtonensis TaxID=58919 RepID=A0A316Z886_9BASI|nr:hypothetical protein FA09DRAFT_346442 [Tilletiopsis washingtonensis]PWN97152.1 hypothetical protein FA09DRAFT_346442 [Tilletiopsis washingtonensis]